MTGKIDIQGGKIVFGSARFKQAIRELKDGSYMWSLEEWKDARTKLQNAFIHVCFDVYGKEMGYSPKEAKWYLKKWFGINRIGRDPRTGKQEPIVRDTKEYSMEEMTVFIERLLNHFEHDCGMIIDPKIRKQYRIDEITGELKEMA